MIYTKIYSIVKNLINTPVKNDDMKGLLTGENNELLKRLASCCINMQDSVSLKDIVRCTLIEEKHAHVIICELSNDIIACYGSELDGSTLLSPSACKYKDDFYTVIFTERLDNKSRMCYKHILYIFSLIFNEYDSYLSNSYNAFVSDSQDFISKVFTYAPTYLAIGICHCNDIKLDEMLKSDSVIEFLNCIEEQFDSFKNDRWVAELFDNESLSIVEEMGYKNILYDLRDGLDEDNNDIEDDYDEGDE